MRMSVLALAGVAALAAAWTGLWSYGAHEANRQLDGWLAEEAQAGRRWTCPERQIGGYPFGLELSCRTPSFAGQALGASVEGSVAALQAGVSVLHPTRVGVTLAPPFAYRSADRSVEVRGQWTALQVDLDGLPDLSHIALAGQDVVVSGVFGPAGRQSLPAARLVADLTPPRGEANPTLGFDIAVSGVELPEIDTLVGDTKPSDLAFRGTLDHADAADARTPEEAMERWRQAGGMIALAAASLVRETSRASASGTLGLDAAHRAAGHLDADFVGLGPILQRYGLNPRLVAAGGLLSHLLGGGNAKPPSQPGAIAMPVTLRDGFLSVGPIRTGVALLPLY